MGGGVNPLEWILPPVALTHVAYNSAAQLSGQNDAKLVAPGSSSDLAQQQDDARMAALQQQQDAQTQAQAALDARTETPAEALDAKRRAGLASVALGGGKRRASQTLTDAGASLSGTY